MNATRRPKTSPPALRTPMARLPLVVLTLVCIAAPHAQAQKEGPLSSSLREHIAKNGNDTKRPSAKETDEGEHSTAPHHAAQPSIDGLDEGACPICPITDPGEVHVLLALRERRLIITAQEHQLAQREAQLTRLARSLDDKLATLDAQVQKIEERLQIGEPARQRREAALSALVDSLGSMTPKKAAPMLAEAEPTVVAEVLRRLGPQRSAQLMMAMPANRAGRLINQVVPAKHAGAARPAAAPAAPAAGVPATPPTTPPAAPSPNATGSK